MFQIVMLAAGKRARQGVELAWLGAVLSRAKKIPNLAELFKDTTPMEPQELQAHMRALAETMPKRSWEEWRRMSSEP